ncbi:hypothetical protein IFR05_007217 [Cadophora sp. M221]|nr:hypothetical protein IFR05_007217 [Cadophora sp. M221]
MSSRGSATNESSAPNARSPRSISSHNPQPGSWTSVRSPSSSRIGSSTADSPIHTPRSSVFVSRTNTISTDSASGSPLHTPQSSSQLSSHTVSESTSSRRESAPIPSIEFPDSIISETADIPTPRNISTRMEHGSSSYGSTSVRTHSTRSDLRSSQLTYRGLYNTTPEPEAQHDGGSSPTTSQQRLRNSASNSTTQSRSSSAPVQSAPINTPAAGRQYDVNDEPAPDGPYFNVEFQRGLRQAKLVAARIANFLETCELARDRDSQIYSMIQTANELRSFVAPSVCTIGIVGDSGVGKSSLINSLLDEMNLADTASLGAACTSVVTEYRSRLPQHSAKYTIEIDRMTDSEIEEQLQELLWSYRFYHITDLDDIGMGADEQARLEAQSKLAWDTLKAAFGSKRELTETYLRDPGDGAKERIQNRLKEWSSTLRWPRDSHESGWLGSAETADECKSQTQQFKIGNLWPFVKVIRIYLSSQVLKSGAVLADLPGFHDSNNARVKAAESYMYKCDEVFVVADITRVSTNKNVELIFQKSLGSNLTNGRPSQGISLICTRSEDIDGDEISQKFFSSRRNPNTGRVKQLKETIDDIECNPERPGALRQRDEAQDELNYLFMTARNEHIEKLVQRNHGGLFMNRKLSVFCVSNKAYSDYRRRIRVHELPIKGSGIPALRSHCHKIPAQAQFRISHHFLTVTLKAFMQRVQLWLAGGSQETMPNDATVQRLLDSITRDLKRNSVNFVQQTEEEQKNIAKDSLIQPMTMNLSTWTQSALQASQGWNSLHHTQYAAFCRGLGSFGSAKCPWANWNLELIEPMIDTMSISWEEYVERIATSMEELERRVVTSLEALLTQVKDFSGAPLFAEAVETKIVSIKYAFSVAGESLESQMEFIERNASSDHPNAYIREAMVPVYRACSADSGSGVTSRSHARIREAIGSPRFPILLKGIRSCLQKALYALIKDTMKDLHRDINQLLRQISTNIEMLRGSEARVLAMNGDFLDRLKIVLGAAMEEMENIQEVASYYYFTYNTSLMVGTVTVTASPVTTVTSGPIPSSTLIDPDATASSGTSTFTSNVPSTVTTTVVQSSVDSRTASTVTVQPTTCQNAQSTL